MPNGQMKLSPIAVNRIKLQAYLETLKNGTEIQITSMPQMNRIIGGFERKKLVVIGARPSEGKSAFALQLAYEFSKKFRVLYMSLEMTTEEAMFRLMCHHKKIENTIFYRGNFDYAPCEEFYQTMQKENRRLIIIDEHGKNWGEVNAIMETLGEDPPDIIFMDYVQCIKTSGKRMDEIEDYIKNFRKIAIEKNICVFLLSQINRTNIVENKEPTMEGLKATGVLEEHADKVILLYYPCKRSENISVNIFKVIVSKNKNGLTGYIPCHIIPSQYRFYEIVRNAENELKEEQIIALHEQQTEVAWEE